ncbi:alpha/beta fold hydrolase [Paractinoplanes maris]|uniref:alpha/beta fold hydrolase n=1 Tax=Paractinoplanes maris TaxID=1734446 RepID=UPI002021A364|nr:alpha/beta hydrolase [Actinoplanes maris]
MSSTSHTRRLRITAVAAATTAALAVVPAASASATTQTPAKPTIVLVHGAWADASSFAPVTALLQRRGYTVLNAPNPLRGLAADSASVAAFVNQATTGPVVLVGHSYGGAVITNAATSTPRVTALTYVDAYAPDAGETVVQLTGAKPGSALAAPVESVFDVVQDPSSPQGDVDLYVKRSLFPQAFAAHLPAAAGTLLASSQSPIAAGALQEPSGAPAWKSKPSWFVIGTQDKVIPAAEQQVMAARAHGTTVTVTADHLSMVEKPTVVAATIEQAARR